MQSTDIRHAVLASIGTDGDVYPFLNLGIELQRRGLNVTLATHEHFKAQASKNGLAFQQLVSNSQTAQLLENPAFWHPVKGTVVVARWGSRMVRAQYEVLKGLASLEQTLFVASPGVLAARVLQEQRKIRLVSVLLQPWVIPSLQAPPTMMSGLTLPRRAPRIVGRLYFRLIDAAGRWIVGPQLDKLRKPLGLPPVRNLSRWWFSPELTIALFPDWFGNPQPDWPEQVRLTDFPLVGSRTQNLSAELTRFCNQDRPVIAFTFGTGMMHAQNFFAEAISACSALRSRAVFLTRFSSQLPNQLPEFVHHCEFASFEDLFPLCAVIVHHGGIGTTATALAAGTPQLIIPFAFDQLDNALRVKSLHAGAWLRPNECNHQTLAAALKTLMTPQASTAARRVALRLQNRNGLQRASDHIEAWFKKQNYEVRTV